MAGLDENGLTIKRLPDILAELQAAIKQQYGNDTPVDANSFFGILNTIYGASDAELWELTQFVYNQMNRSTASNKGLDDLAAILRMFRLEPTYSSGTLSMYGDQGTLVPLGTEFRDTNNNYYESTKQVSLDTHLQRIPILFRPTEGAGASGELSTTYTITINGDVYSKQFEWEWSAISSVVRQDLYDLIGDRPEYYVVQLSDNDPLYINESSALSGTGKFTLNIVNKDPLIPLTVSVSIIQSPFPNHYNVSGAAAVVGAIDNKYTADANVQSVTVGQVRTAEQTLTTIGTPVAGLDTVVNYNEMFVGTDLETDEELRSRMKEGRYTSGFNTLPSMNAKLAETSGVTGVNIKVNKTLVEADGLDGKSFECIVQGGTDTDVATTILNNMSIEDNTQGDITVIIDDSTGTPRAVRFSRSDELYVWSKVTYTLDEETNFPLEGGDLMKDAIITYGNAIALGMDINPKKFFGSVYSSTTGIGDLNITFATSLSNTIEPDFVDFTDDIIILEGTEDSIFELDLIEVTRI